MTSTRTFPPTSAALRGVRTFVAGELDGVDLECAEIVVLLASELATNCVRHAGTPYTVRIARSRRQVRVEVRDDGSGNPTMRSPARSEVTGRGLQIVDRACDRWGASQDGKGATVWFEVDL